MSVASSIRFFKPGHPGFVLGIVVVIIGAGFGIKQCNDKRQAETDKHRKTRELGQVSPTASVDVSQASKESILSDRKLSSGFKSDAEVVPVRAAPAFVIPSAPKALPQLVSFYTQVAATPTPTPVPEQRPKVQEIWLPPSIFIPCALVNTIDSSHINTPVVGEVIRDVYQNGHLIIPGGTLVSSFAQAGAVRDRIEVAGEWLLVFNDGRQLKVNGIACNREADPSNQQFGVADGSAGLKGELIESDHWANAKAFIALLMTSTTQAATAAASGVLSREGGGVSLPDTSGIMAHYLDQLLNGETGDGRFVRVPASTEFYIFPTETVLPRRRSIENSARTKDEEAPYPISDDPMKNALQLQRELLRGAQPNPSPQNENRFRY